MAMLRESDQTAARIGQTTTALVIMRESGDLESLLRHLLPRGLVFDAPRAKVTAQSSVI